jgi:hypothetical protein
VRHLNRRLPDGRPVLFNRVIRNKRNPIQIVMPSPTIATTGKSPTITGAARVAEPTYEFEFRTNIEYKGSGCYPGVG